MGLELPLPLAAMSVLKLSLPVPVPGPKPAAPEPVPGPSFCPNPAPATAPETVPEMQAQAGSDSPKTSLGCCEIQSLTGSEMLSRAKKRAHKRLTNNLLEGLCFHSDALHFIQSDPDYFGKDAIEVILAACQDDTMSTSFSGIEAPHTASCANLAEFLGIDQKLVPMPRLLHMIEWEFQNCTPNRKLLIWRYRKLLPKGTAGNHSNDQGHMFNQSCCWTLDNLKF